MINVYDIIVNPSSELIDFYDWKNSDSLLHLKKCILCKVSTNTYIDFLTREIIISESFYQSIKNKTEVFTGYKVNKNTSFIIANSINALYIEVDNNRKVKCISKLLINEEIEVISISKRLKNTLIDYKTYESKRMNILTRNQKDKIDNILNILNSFKNDKDKINYICSEWFNNKSEHTFNELVNDIKSGYFPKHDKLLETLKILY